MILSIPLPAAPSSLWTPWSLSVLFPGKLTALGWGARVWEAHRTPTSSLLCLGSAGTSELGLAGTNDCARKHSRQTRLCLPFSALNSEHLPQITCQTEGTCDPTFLGQKTVVEEDGRATGTWWAEGKGFPVSSGVQDPCWRVEALRQGGPRSQASACPERRWKRHQEHRPPGPPFPPHPPPVPTHCPTQLAVVLPLGDGVEGLTAAPAALFLLVAPGLRGPSSGLELRKANGSSQLLGPLEG